MKVQIAKWGNSAAVRLPKAVLEEMGVVPGSQLDLVVEGRQLRLTPTRATVRLEDLVAEMKRLGGADYDYGQDLWPDRIEDWPEYGDPDIPEGSR